jgi:hypothetical protein
MGLGVNRGGGDQEGIVMSDVLAWPADRRITVRDLQAATDRGERWSMLTSYDALTPAVVRGRRCSAARHGPGRRDQGR